MLYFVAIRMNPINTQALSYAKDYSSTAIALGHDPDNYLTRAMINSALKNYGEALIDCDEAIKYSPKYFRPYLKRADIKVFDLGQIDDGLIDAERALALAQTDQEKADVWGLKGMAYENKAFKLLNRESALLVKKAFDSYETLMNISNSPK
jgi:tetratricopeptide (TPR) repeat protein